MSVKSKDRSPFSSKKNPIVRSLIPTMKISKEIKAIKMKMTYHRLFELLAHPVEIPWLANSSIIDRYFHNIIIASVYSDTIKVTQSYKLLG